MTDEPARRGPGRPKATPPKAKAPVGRPRYAPKAEQRKMVEHLIAAGETHANIGELLGISQPVFRSRFAIEIADARPRLRSAFIAVVFEKALEGSATHLKMALDLTALPEEHKPYVLPTAQPEAPPEPKPEKLGKKERQALAAQNPDVSTPMGELMARRAKGHRVQ